MSALAPVQAPRPSVVRSLLPHLVWEAILLVATVIVCVSLVAVHSNVFDHGTIWGQTAFVALYAGALALSLRTATPNLAVPAIGAASGFWYARLVTDGTSPAVAWLVALLAAAGIGLVLGLLVGLTRLPAWAASLVTMIIVSGTLRLDDNTKVVPVHGQTSNDTFLVWVVLFAIGSVAAGALFAVPRVRSFLSQNRPQSAGAPSTLGGRLVGALIGLCGSSLLAGIGGVLLVLRIRAAQPFDTVGLMFALTAVLLGGVSLLGRRAGLIGVPTAVLLLAFLQIWMSLDGVASATQQLVLGILGLVGLGINALLELLGNLLERPRTGPAPAPAPWMGPPVGLEP